MPPAPFPPLPSPLLLWRAGWRALRRLQQLRRCLRHHGCLLLCGTLWAPPATLNGRQYRRQDVERELAALPAALCGAFGHPSPHEPSFARPPPPGEASHRLAWHWVGERLEGGLFLLNTPAGRLLLHAFLHGSVGASLRGFARLSPSLEGGLAADDLQLVTFDVVEQPAGRATLAPFLSATVPGWLKAVTEPEL